MDEARAKGRPGRTAALKPEHGPILEDIAREPPRSSMDEFTREFNRRSGLNVCSATVRAALRRAGITRMRRIRQPTARAAVPGGRPLRVGSTDRHRRQDGASGMNTDLTDAEWALMADLFERRGGRGASPVHERRPLVVDTLGVRLAVTITAASVQDRDGAAPVVAQARTQTPGLKKLYADAADGGQCALTLEKPHGISVEIVRHPGNRATGTWPLAQPPPRPDVAPTGFVVQAKRWVVERAHAWNERARRSLPLDWPGNLFQKHPLRPS
jgi:transposase